MSAVVYRAFDADEHLLYVGVTGGRASRRMRQHARDAVWWDSAITIKLEHFETREDALRAEARAIATEVPLHNVIGFAGVLPTRGVRSLLYRHRLQRHLTRDELVARSGVKLRTIRALESTPGRVPHNKTLAALARAFEVDADELLAAIHAERRELIQMATQEATA